MPNPDLRDEMKAPVEPLLPIEKKLIGWSLSLGLALLALLVLLNRVAPLY
jgi:hypothetical protein